MRAAELTCYSYLCANFYPANSGVHGQPLHLSTRSHLLSSTHCLSNSALSSRIINVSLSTTLFPAVYKYVSLLWQTTVMQQQSKCLLASLFLRLPLHFFSFRANFSERVCYNWRLPFHLSHSLLNPFQSGFYSTTPGKYFLMRSTNLFPLWNPKVNATVRPISSICSLSAPWNPSFIWHPGCYTCVVFHLLLWQLLPDSFFNFSSLPQT